MTGACRAAGDSPSACGAARRGMHSMACPSHACDARVHAAQRTRQHHARPARRLKPRGASLAEAIKDDERLAGMGEQEILAEFREQVGRRVGVNRGPVHGTALALGLAPAAVPAAAARPAVGALSVSCRRMACAGDCIGPEREDTADLILRQAASVTRRQQLLAHFKQSLADAAGARHEGARGGAATLRSFSSQKQGAAGGRSGIALDGGLAGHLDQSQPQGPSMERRVLSVTAPAAGREFQASPSGVHPQLLVSGGGDGAATLDKLVALARHALPEQQARGMQRCSCLEMRQSVDGVSGPRLQGSAAASQGARLRRVRLAEGAPRCNRHPIPHARARRGWQSSSAHRRCLRSALSGSSGGRRPMPVTSP